MKNLLLITILFLASCVSDARRWRVDNVNNAASNGIVAAAMVWLDTIWKRWPVSFTLKAQDNEDGIIEINYIAHGTLVGRAYAGAEKLRGPMYGVFYKKMRDDNRYMSDQAMGQWVAMVISHEIGHAYGLVKHDDGRYVMNSSVPRTYVPWSPKSIEHLDKVLGLRDG